MRIIPAVDLMNGRCVRLVQGRKEKAIYYDKEPVDVAKDYYENGAERIHVIDLDGAFSGEMKNVQTIKEIAGKVPIQVGGGIRNEGLVRELLAAGVKKVILSTLLIKKPELAEKIKKRYRKRVIASFDFKDGRLAYAGWEKQSDLDFEELIQGFKEVIITDIGRDGTLSGPNLKLLKSLKRRYAGRIIAAGGISSIRDIVALKKIGIFGVILGRSLFEGKILLKEAITCSQEE